MMIITENIESLMKDTQTSYTEWLSDGGQIELGEKSEAVRKGNTSPHFRKRFASDKLCKHRSKSKIS